MVVPEIRMLGSINLVFELQMKNNCTKIRTLMNSVKLQSVRLAYRNLLLFYTPIMNKNRNEKKIQFKTGNWQKNYTTKALKKIFM